MFEPRFNCEAIIFVSAGGCCVCAREPGKCNRNSRAQHFYFFFYIFFCDRTNVYFTGECAQKRSSQRQHTQTFRLDDERQQRTSSIVELTVANARERVRNRSLARDICCVREFRKQTAHTNNKIKSDQCRIHPKKTEKTHSEVTK